MDSLPAIFITIISFIILLQQTIYLNKKRLAPGPNFVFPFIGNAISLIRNPTSFWDRQSTMAKSAHTGYSVNHIFGKFIVFIQSTDLSRKVFTNVRPDAFHLVVYPFGKTLFGEHNILYLMGQQHKDLRRRIAPNFTPKALSIYLHLQQHIILNHMKSWPVTESVTLQPLCRDMNLETSQSVFVGPCNEYKKTEFKSDYYLFSQGLTSLPIDLPGFAFRDARLAVNKLVNTLTRYVDESKTKMNSGVFPTCLVDFWMQHDVVTDSTEIARHLFDFLFAAQDASTASLLWAVTLLDSHRDVLNKVREEVAGIWSPECDELITFDEMKELRYTEAVAKEVIRYRTPAAMIPHVTGEDFPLTETYTIPKGAIVFPSVFESSFQGFVDPERFDPDRFLGDRQEDLVYKKNYLAFGVGAHQCVGQRYAINHLVLFIAMFTAFFDFKRDRMEGCDEIVYLPAIYPRDGCKVVLSRRCVS